MSRRSSRSMRPFQLDFQVRQLSITIADKVHCIPFSVSINVIIFLRIYWNFKDLNVLLN